MVVSLIVVAKWLVLVRAWARTVLSRLAERRVTRVTVLFMSLIIPMVRTQLRNLALKLVGLVGALGTTVVVCALSCSLIGSPFVVMWLGLRCRVSPGRNLRVTVERIRYILLVPYMSGWSVPVPLTTLSVPVRLVALLIKTR